MNTEYWMKHIYNSWKICTVQADVKWTVQNFGGQNRNEI